MKRSQLGNALVITILITIVLGVNPAITSASIVAITPPSIDTSANSHKIQSISSSSSGTVSIVTSVPNEVIYFTAYSQNQGRRLTIASTPALTWNYRGGTNSTNGEMAVWWAVSSSAQTVQVTITSSQKINGAISGFCVKDVDTTSPFDPNLSTVTCTNGIDTTASTTITTSYPYQLIASAVVFTGTNTITAGAGYTQLDNTGSSTPASAIEYKFTTSAGADTPTFTSNKKTNWVIIAEAFVPAKVNITITSSPQTSSGFVTVNGTAQSTPYTASYTPGSVLSISATGAKTGTGVRYLFSSWNDSGAQTHYYTVQSQDATIVADYQTQYQVTFAQSGLDSSVASTVLTGPLLTINNTVIHYANFSYSLWVNSGDKLVFSYNTTAASYMIGKQFSLSSTSATSPLTVSAAQTITGTYLIQYLVNFAVSPDGTGTIDRSDGYYTAGSPISITGSPGSEYLFRNWTSSSGSITFTDPSSASTSMDVNGVGTVTAYFKLKPSTVLTMDTDIDTIDKGNPLTISGVLSYDDVGLFGKPIEISYFNGTTLINLDTVTTDSNGAYQYIWNIPVTMPNGMYIIRSDFAGDSQYAAASSADSSGTITVNVLPEYEYGSLLVIIIGLLTMSLYIRKQKKHKQTS